MTRALRVFVSGTSFLPSYGGPAYSVSRLAVALAQWGLEVGLWSADRSVMSRDLLSDESRVRKLDGSIEKALATFGHPDIIHDNGLWLRHNHSLAAAARRARVPRMVSTRGMLEPWALAHKGLKKKLAWVLYQERDLRQAAGIHASTPVEQTNLLRLELGTPIHVVPNGVDLPNPIPRRVAGATRRAVFIGRLYPVKGLPMLIEAWGATKPAGWTLTIAGPDEAGHLAELQTLVSRRGLSDCIDFPGPLGEAGKARLFSEADLLILPTHSENFGMAVAESLAHAVPVLTTNAAPWPQLAEEKCGWRVEVSADAIAQGIRVATALPREALNAMGDRGRRVVERTLDWSTVATRMIEAYGRCIG